MKKMNWQILLIVVYFTFLLNTHAQIFRFQKTYGTSSPENFNSLIEYSDGGFVLTGWQVQLNYKEDIYVVRTDKAGNQLWAKTFGDTLVQYATGVGQTVDGNLVVTGVVYGLAGMVAISLDSSGSSNWMRKYLISGSEQGQCMITTNNGFIIGGGAYNTIDLNDASMVKIDLLGNILWSKRYRVTGTEEIIESIKVMQDGSLIFTGVSYKPSTAVTQAFLAKTDSLGNPIWFHFYKGGINQIYDLDVLTDGSIILCGFGTALNMVLLKTNSNGNLIWAKSLRSSGTILDYGSSVKTLPDGNILLTGATAIIPSSTNFGSDIALIKCDTSGTVIWSKNYGGSIDDRSDKLILCNDGGYAFCGATEVGGTGPIAVPGFARLIKTDANGFSGCNEYSRSYLTSSLITTDSAATISTFSEFISMVVSFPEYNAGTDSTICISTDVNNIQLPENSLTVIPNPAKSCVSITINKNLDINENLFLMTDLTGKTVLFEKINGKSSNVSLENVKPGIYLYFLKSSDKINVTGKLIVY